MNADPAVDPGSIRQRAYELWERDGRPGGREVEYWVRAEAALAREAGVAPEDPSLAQVAPVEGMPRGIATEPDPGLVARRLQTRKPRA